MTSVFLEPVNENIYNRVNLEPQYVTTRTPNRAILYLDSQDCTLELNKADILMSTISSPGENPSKLSYGINRITIPACAIYNNIPNVNPRNNVITFFSSNSGLFHTVTVPEGFYTTPTALITAIVAALNTATGASGLTFSFTVISGFPDRFNLNSAGGNYFFDLNSLGVKFGYQLWNLPTEQVATNTKIVGDIIGFYSRYVDITSDTISKYAKVRTLTTGKGSNVIIRLYFIDYTKPNLRVDTNFQRPVYNFLPSEPIYSIQFTLRDQFGAILYIPPGAQGTAGGFFWNIQLLIEI